jgi:hypothetical protein
MAARFELMGEVYRAEAKQAKKLTLKQLRKQQAEATKRVREWCRKNGY